MSTPNTNKDETDAVERLNQDNEPPTSTLQSTNTAESQENQHISNGSGHRTDSFDPYERITELETVTDVLQTENERLRTDYARARVISYKKTALALAVLGVIAILGGVILPDVRAVLFVIGAIGLFSGVMTWYLTPGRVVPVSVGESVYDGAMMTLTNLRDELGLQPITVYVPHGTQTRAFIPREHDFEIPENISHVFPGDTSGSGGLTFTPSGQELTREVDEIRTTHDPSTTLGAVEQIANSLVEHFEVADDIVVEKSTVVREVKITITDPAFGPVTRLDHPIVSALACAAAQSVNAPVVIDSVDDTTVTLSVASEAAEE
ncbi:hypothetical protein PM035_14740 [Halorubrum ezzemoulense]|uniref:hypothetical protein n=1 Tax=Halorubrum ezzemoulense TaxID=337243 RepID=UPI00232D1C7C|nr:hypothetical protein [Halorubrum ezzemoulense]MDB2262086.1 hypothetical protein [Halorubrum ezzemoulense]MDB2268933.1 hypothetical protein [Halorubrum ezzemoulense]